MMDAATAANGSGHLPHPGDHTVCIRCGAVMVFDADRMLRGMTDAEIAELTANQPLMDEIGRVVRNIHFMHAARN